MRIALLAQIALNSFFEKRGSRYATGTGRKPRRSILIDTIVHVQDELRRRTGDSLAVRHLIEGPPHLGMLLYVFANVIEAFAR